MTAQIALYRPGATRSNAEIQLSAVATGGISDRMVSIRSAIAQTPDGLPPIREMIADAGLDARRSLGQNFLLDLNLTRKIARAAAPLDQSRVIEVGSGPGGLTRALLLEGAQHVFAIEQDSRARPILERISTHFADRLTLIWADARSVDYHSLGADSVVANLPYNVATPLLTGWLVDGAPNAPWWSSMVLMFQRELAQRIVAQPGSKAYGRLSVLSGWRSDARLQFDVPARAFTPPPKVTSSIVRFVPRTSETCDPRALERVTAAAFGQRRKKIRSSLKSLHVPIDSLLRETGIDPDQRAENLSIEEYVALARQLVHLSKD